MSNGKILILYPQSFSPHCVISFVMYHLNRKGIKFKIMIQNPVKVRFNYKENINDNDIISYWGSDKIKEDGVFLVDSLILFEKLGSSSRIPENSKIIFLETMDTSFNMIHKINTFKIRFLDEGPILNHTLCKVKKTETRGIRDDISNWFLTYPLRKHFVYAHDNFDETIELFSNKMGVGYQSFNYDDTYDACIKKVFDYMNDKEAKLIISRVIPPFDVPGISVVHLIGSISIQVYRNLVRKMYQIAYISESLSDFKIIFYVNVDDTSQIESYNILSTYINNTRIIFSEGYQKAKYIDLDDIF